MNQLNNNDFTHEDKLSVQESFTKLAESKTLSLLKPFITDDKEQRYCRKPYWETPGSTTLGGKGIADAKDFPCFASFQRNLSDNNQFLIKNVREIYYGFFTTKTDKVISDKIMDDKIKNKEIVTFRAVLRFAQQNSGSQSVEILEKRFRIDFKEIAKVLNMLAVYTPLCRDNQQIVIDYAVPPLLA